MTTIKIEKRIGTKWINLSVPLTGVTRVNASKLGTGYRWLSVLVTVVEGALTISSIKTSGLHSPKLTAPAVGTKFAAGASFTVSCSVGPLDATHTGSWGLANYYLYTKELGKIIGVAAQVVYSA